VVLEGEPHDEEISASVTSSSHNFQPHAFLAKPQSELRVKPRSILNACVTEENFSSMSISGIICKTAL
jgi:hypothetical protein